MKIIEIPDTNADRLVPLLQDLHALHVEHQPARHTNHPDAAELGRWLKDMLQDENITALAAESPQGALLGYLIYEVEHRRALPVRAAETRAMLQHIAVQHAWQRMGIGKALMKEMKYRVDQQGIKIIATSYAPFNAASAALMSGMGLEPVLTTAEWRA